MTIENIAIIFLSLCSAFAILGMYCLYVYFNQKLENDAKEKVNLINDVREVVDLHLQATGFEYVPAMEVPTIEPLIGKGTSGDNLIPFGGILASPKYKYTTIPAHLKLKEKFDVDLFHKVLENYSNKLGSKKLTKQQIDNGLKGMGIRPM